MHAAPDVRVRATLHNSRFLHVSRCNGTFSVQKRWLLHLITIRNKLRWSVKICDSYELNLRSLRDISPVWLYASLTQFSLFFQNMHHKVRMCWIMLIYRIRSLSSVFFFSPCNCFIWDGGLKFEYFDWLFISVRARCLSVLQKAHHWKDYFQLLARYVNYIGTTHLFWKRIGGSIWLLPDILKFDLHVKLLMSLHLLYITQRGPVHK